MTANSYEQLLSKLSSANDLDAAINELKSNINDEAARAATTITSYNKLLRQLQRRSDHIRNYFDTIESTHKTKDGVLLAKTDSAGGDTSTYIRCDQERISLSDNEVFSVVETPSYRPAKSSISP